MKTLQCHTKGDQRFSPFCCYVEAFGIKRSIEDHYQSAKRFEGQKPPQNWREAKAFQKAGIKRIGFELPNGIWLPPETNNTTDLAIQYYIALWYKYLKLNPHLIEYAIQFDEFVDIFKGKFPFCQADVIRQSVKHGIDSLKPMCEEFLTLCRQIITQDILTVEKGIIGHQVNCQGVMGAGLAKQIKAKYPAAWFKYRLTYSHAQEYEQALLGECVTCQLNDELYIAHLFGQFFYGNDGQKYTEYRALTAALMKLNRFAQSQQLPIYLPYKIGCGLAGGDWQIVYNIIRKYCPSAIICKLPT